MILHTFGDSHSKFGWENINGIVIHWLGPKLCYSFGRDKLNLLNIKEYGVLEGDSVLFSFGEIDCRAHIYKYESESNPYTKIIDNMINEYFDAIYMNVSQYKNINTFIYFLPPADITKATKLTEQELEEYVYKHIDKTQHSLYPWLGRNEDRKKYFTYFYNRLKLKCIEYNYTMFDIYDKYCDQDGYIIDQLSDKSIHIHDPIYLIEFINKNHINI